MVKRGLGRGFDALIPTDLATSEFAPADEKTSDLREIDIDLISPNANQPRKNFAQDELDNLATSIREHGILQPIILTPISGGKFEIVAGERRWRAAKIANLAKIPAIVRTLSEQHKAELSIIENVQRADLNPIEVAASFSKLRQDFGLTVEQIARKVGKKAPTVGNILRLLDLPINSKRALISGEITEGHARQILALPNGKAREALLNEIRKNHWSVRKAEQYVLGFKAENGTVSSTTTVKDSRSAVADKTELTEAIAQKIGLDSDAVSQKITAHGGQIIIKFRDENDLLKIRAALTKKA